MRLRCEFNLTGARRCVYVDRLDKVSQGFWVNAGYELTQGSDALYWVPPAQIIHVTKEAEPLAARKKK